VSGEWFYAQYFLSRSLSINLLKTVITRAAPSVLAWRNNMVSVHAHEAEAADESKR
jgi:hypothetical protein